MAIDWLFYAFPRHCYCEELEWPPEVARCSQMREYTCYLAPPDFLLSPITQQDPVGHHLSQETFQAAWELVSTAINLAEPATASRQ